jgi:RNA polymerase sigma factor (sigma-70 family)
MQNISDEELLKDFAERGSEAAFREIVNRHTDLVYSAAMRQVPSPDLARDVAQMVFVDLARKAKVLTAKSSDAMLLVGWLYRSARYTSLNLLRHEGRRRSREQKAMEEINSPEESVDWESIGAVLDEAMTNLGDEDRDALLLRFFKNENFQTVGSRLGVSSDAAQKRVSRALDKLRENLGRMGITTTAAALSVVLCANAVQAAPLGLSATISGAAVASALIAVSTITTQTTMSWFSAKLITTVVAAAVVSSTGTYLIQQGKINGLRGENQHLVSQEASLASERDAALARRAATEKELQRFEKERTELLRLRGEVGLLRKQSNDLAKLTAENREMRGRLNTGRKVEAAPAPEVAAENHYPKEKWAFAGYATPEAAIHSWTWAMATGNKTAMFDGLAPEKWPEWQKEFSEKSDEELVKEATNESAKILGYDLLAKEMVSEDVALLTIVIQEANKKKTQPQQYKMQKFADGWKMVGPAE